MAIAYILHVQGYCKFNSCVYFFFFFSVFRKKVNITNTYLGRILYWNISSSFMSYIQYCKCLLQLRDDIELNPGPKPNSCKSVSICYRNLNSITSRNFIKVSLLMAYNSIYNFDIICLSETYPYSERLSNDENLNVPSYNLIKADHLANTKRGEVCIYYLLQ